MFADLKAETDRQGVMLSATVAIAIHLIKLYTTGGRRYGRWADK